MPRHLVDLSQRLSERLQLIVQLGLLWTDLLLILAAALLQLFEQGSDLIICRGSLLEPLLVGSKSWKQTTLSCLLLLGDCLLLASHILLGLVCALALILAHCCETCRWGILAWIMTARPRFAEKPRG